MVQAGQRGPLALSLFSSGIQVEIGPFLARIRSELPCVVEHIRTLYADFPIRSASDGHFDVAIIGGKGLHRWWRRQALLVVNGVTPYLPVPALLGGAALEWGLNWCIGTRAHTWMALHAAVVERGGSVVILPAPPGAGKSTLCAALVYSGWRLFSDEFALVDPRTCRVFPAPRPISLKEASIDILRRRHPGLVHGPEGRDVEGLRFVHARPPAASVQRAHEDASARWVIFPRYAPGKRTTIEPLPKAHALMELLGQSFNFGYVGAAGFECLSRLVAEAQCCRLEYSDLDDVLDRLDRLVAA